MANKNLKRKKTKTRKKMSINAILWTIMLTSILIYALSNLSTIRNTITKLSNVQKKSTEFEKDAVPPPSTDDTPTTLDDPVEESPKLEQKNKNEQNSLPDTEKTDENNNQDTTIFLVQIQANETLQIIAATREIPSTKAILTQTLKELLKGSNNTEIQKGLKSFIPPNSKLISVSVKNRIAYVNFDESFLFNPGGRSATTAQIFQLVYTCTEFSTIDKVQILINKKRVQYLSGEGGISVYEPLTRASLP